MSTVNQLWSPSMKTSVRITELAEHVEAQGLVEDEKLAMAFSPARDVDLRCGSIA